MSGGELTREGAVSAIRKWAITVLVGLVLIVLFQNVQKVTITFLFWQVSVSQIILLPLVLALGVGLGFLVRGKI